MLSYKGYTAEIKVDVNAGILTGRVLDIKDTVTFQGRTVEEATQEFHMSVDAYLMFCQELGQKPDRPFSGKLPFRTTPDNHRAIYLAAAEAEKSINAWMEEILSRAAIGLSTESPERAEDSPSVRYIIQEKNIAELLDKISPFLLGRNPRSDSQLIVALEKLLVGLDAIRPLLKVELPHYDAVSRVVNEIEIFLKKIPSHDEMYPPASDSSAFSAQYSQFSYPD
ncbi:MAG: type II toxin-antitoxin system HicB family antitoxin [Cyanothece sp. SIO1E1]|nr:type II toxin-antitoxin system HicB family antitoxin [Cyanothece sp. SIO1E1]